MIAIKTKKELKTKTADPEADRDKLLIITTCIANVHIDDDILLIKLMLKVMLFILDKPEGVQLLTSEEPFCSGTNIIFNCTADSNPPVHTYQLFESEVLLNDNSNSGVWNRTMLTGGEFVYKCVVNNTIGTASSANVTITVNGKQHFFVVKTKKKS